MMQTAHTRRRISEALEAFEQNWRADAGDWIAECVALAEVNESEELTTELIRCDIDRRYSAGLPVHLELYFHRFAFLQSSPQRASEVCYEDFRARRSRGFSCAPDRWSSFSGVPQQEWFQSLLSTISRYSGSDSSPEQPMEVSRFPEPGEHCGDFRIVALLGTGAFSRVYLAQQIPLGSRYVALKIVNRPFREPWHLARLAHTGVVPLFSCHRSGGLWLLCMPYTGSATLADWLRRDASPDSRSGQSLAATVRNAQQQLTEIQQVQPDQARPEILRQPVEQLRQWHTSSSQPLEKLQLLSSGQLALWFLQRISAALAHCHQRGIVHGDLKPANILVRSDGEPALIDFNLASDHDMARAQWAGGTLPYMAPEQLSDLLRQKSVPGQPQTDVFAVGVIMYELLEGKLPFVGPVSTADADLADAIEARRSLPQFHNASVAIGLQSIVRKCLHPDSAQRYASGTELLEDVELQCLNQPLRFASEPLLKSRLPKLIARNPRIFSGGAIVSVALVLVSVLSWGLIQFRHRAERLHAVEALQRFTEQSDSIVALCLMADSSETVRSASSILPLMELSLSEFQLNTETSAGLWKNNDRIQSLTELEERFLQERLISIAALSAHSAVKPGQTSDSDGRALSQLLKTLLQNLPEEAQQWRAVEFVRERLKSGFSADEAGSRHSGSTQRGPMPRPETSANQVDQILYALELAAHGRSRQALQVLDRVTLRDSIYTVYWLTRGRAQLETGLFEEAVSSFTMALRDLPDSPVIYLNRGIACVQKGDFLRAEQEFGTAIEKDRSFLPAWTNRHFVRMTLGKPQQALEDISTAIELQSTSNRLRLIRARAFRQMGRLRDAKEDLDVAMRTPPAAAEDWVSVALARLPDDPQEALSDLLKAETLYGADPMILQSMAHVYSEHLQRPEESIAALTRLLEQEPRFQKALAGRAVLFARSGRIDDAEGDVRTLLELEAELTAESMYQIACVYSLCSDQNSELRPLAMKFLAKSVRRGYGGQFMATDPDLAAVKDTAEFDAVLHTWQMTEDP